MANFYGSARTNYFKVKDDDKFLEALENVPDIEVVSGGDNTVAILVNDGDCGCFPSYTFDDDTGDDHELDLVQLTSEHLVDGEVAIFMECGAEKLRYVSGWAEAINSKGERKSISLTDIYDMAKTLTDKPEDISKAEY